MNAAAWNIVAIVAAFTGVFILHRYGMPFRVSRGRARRQTMYGYIGLALLILAIVAQVLSVLAFRSTFHKAPPLPAPGKQSKISSQPLSK
jgi:hypothetical protein